MAEKPLKSIILLRFNNKPK